MKNFLQKIGIGFILGVIIITISLIRKDSNLFMVGTAGIGMGCFVIGAILGGGSIPSGRSGMGWAGEHRENFMADDKEERHEKIALGGNIILIGIPSLLLLVGYYFLVKNNVF